MPEIDLKNAQRELEKGVVWPFYWIYGPERFKAQEIIKRIRTTVLDGRESSWNEEALDAGETTVEAVLDSANSLVLGGGTRIVFIKNAHLLKSPEALADLLGPSQPKAEIPVVCICLSKDLDRRKKFSKVLLDRAAVVSCEDIPENQRELWIQYLAKRRGMQLSPEGVTQLVAQDPWSLDGIDQELEKISLAGMDSQVILEHEVTYATSGGAEAFLESVFCRDRMAALSQINTFASSPEDALPLLGLLGWNVRQLALVISDRENRTSFAKVNSYLADKFRRWSSHWTLSELILLQKELSHLDYCMKQTPLHVLGLWTDLLIRTL